MCNQCGICGVKRWSRPRQHAMMLINVNKVRRRGNFSYKNEKALSYDRKTEKVIRKQITARKNLLILVLVLTRANKLE